jgi:ribonuclease P protein component
MCPSGASPGKSGSRPGVKQASTRDVRLSRIHRIADSGIFKEAFERGSHYVGGFMVMWTKTGPDASLRLGVIASKRTFRRAVDRNRAKRLLREAYRLNRFRLNGDLDVVLVARRNILKASRQDVEKEFLGLARKAGLVKETE